MKMPSADMASPLVQGTYPRSWTIIHDGADIIPGFGGQLAFTSRAAFDAWVQGSIVIPGHAWFYGTPASILNVEVALLTPNHRLLVLEEAWGWKFPGECPPLNSAQDGQVVLGKLLGGEPTPEQRALTRVTRESYSLYDRPTPEKLFIAAWQERALWNTYQRLEHWEPNAEIGSDGEVLSPQEFDCMFLSLVGNNEHVTATVSHDRFVTGYSLLPGTKMMAFSDSHWGVTSLWEPCDIPRPIPSYLMVLS